MNENNLPLITVVTVVYNAVQHIEETILSVINQTYPRIEYIIIDGGSTDGTVDIIRKYANRLAYWVSEPDKGIFDAMNKGLDKATGEWINFMNAGDCFAEHTVIDTLFRKENTGFLAIYGDAIYIRPTGKEAVAAKGTKVLNTDMPITHQSFFVRTQYAHQIGFDIRYKYAADYNMMHSLYVQYGDSAFLHHPIVVAEYEACTGLTMQHQNDVFREVLRIRNVNIRWFWDFFKYLVKKIIKRL